MKRPHVDSIGMFDLDAESIAARAKAATPPTHIPTVGESLLRGTLGFMLVSAIGFAPWAIFERWFRSMRETHLYIACTAAFSSSRCGRLVRGPYHDPVDSRAKPNTSEPDTTWSNWPR